MTFALSLLDTVPVEPGGDAAGAIEGTVQVAQAAERLGLTRFWIAEHHGQPDMACAQTPLLIGLVAGRTQRLRVGSGGVMLPNHRPRQIAEQFATLEAMFPGRIDLGLGRGGGGEPAVLRALGRRGDDDDTLAADVAELRSLFGGNGPGLLPGCSSVPPMFLLGSSAASAELARRLGLSFAFARHLKPHAAKAAAAAYRGYLIVSVAVVCAESAAVAQDSALHAGLVRNRARDARQAGRTITLDELTDPRMTAAERAAVLSGYAKSGCLIGDPTRVAAGLHQIVRDTGADEIMLTTVETSPADRIRTVEAGLSALTGVRT